MTILTVIRGVDCSVLSAGLALEKAAINITLTHLLCLLNPLLKAATVATDSLVKSQADNDSQADNNARRHFCRLYFCRLKGLILRQSEQRKKSC